MIEACADAPSNNGEARFLEDFPRGPIVIDRAAGTIDLGGYTDECSRVYALACTLCRDLDPQPRPKRFRPPMWRFGVVGEPRGTLNITPHLQLTTMPSVFPFVEPVDRYTITIAIDGARLAATTEPYSSTARIRLISTSAEKDAALCSALEETLAAIESSDWTAVRPSDRSRCMWCGRRLTDDASTQSGYGPDCASKYGLAYGAAQEVAS